MNGEYEHITAGIPVVNPEYRPLGVTGMELSCSVPVTDLLIALCRTGRGDFAGTHALSRFWARFMSCAAGARKLAPACRNCKHLYFRRRSKKDPRSNTGPHASGLWSCRKLGFIGRDYPAKEDCACNEKLFKRRAKSK